MLFFHYIKQKYFLKHWFKSFLVFYKEDFDLFL